MFESSRQCGVFFVFWFCCWVFFVLDFFVCLCVCVCDSKEMEETPELDTNLEAAE